MLLFPSLLQGLRNCGAMDTARLHASLGQVYRKKGAYSHHDARVLLKASVNMALPSTAMFFSDLGHSDARSRYVWWVGWRGGAGSVIAST